MVAAAKIVIEQVRAVHKGASKLFMDAATELLASGAGEHDEGADPTEMLAAALAKLAGHGELRQRSLLTSHSGQTTLMFAAGGNTEIRTPTYIWNFLRQRMNENDLQVRRLTLCADHKGAVFDVLATCRRSSSPLARIRTLGQPRSPSPFARSFPSSWFGRNRWVAGVAEGGGRGGGRGGFFPRRAGRPGWFQPWWPRSRWWRSIGGRSRWQRQG